MKWEGNRQSNNVEDRRGTGQRRITAGSGKMGIGTIVVVLALSYFLDINPMTLLGMVTNSPVSVSSEQAATPPADDQMARFVSTVLADTEDTWTPLFHQQGKEYVHPKLVLFSGSTPTACGTGQSATGPFYCPADQKIYLDTSFFNLMQTRFKAAGDFAQAYVIAHEVGHHVQHLSGILGEVHRRRNSQTEKEANAMSVRTELQADCFAGVWAHHADRTRQILEEGDIEEALRAASAIGDDALQKQAQGHVVPDSFTHGTSAQRSRWFRHGLTEGSIQACNTFAATSL